MEKFKVKNKVNKTLKRILIFGIINIFIGILFYLYFCYASKGYFYSYDMLKEAFDRLYFFTYFPIFLGLFYLISFFYFNNTIKSIIIIMSFLLFLPIILYIIPVIFRFPFYFNSFTYVILFFILLFFSIKIFINIKYDKNLYTRRNFQKRQIKIIIFFTFFLVLTSYKFIEIVFNYKYVPSYTEFNKIKDGLNKNEIIDILGQPHFKFYHYNTDKSENFTVIFEDSKLLRVYPVNSKNIILGTYENDIISTFGEPAYEKWIYSYTIYDSEVNNRNIYIKNGKCSLVPLFFK